jgi:hypothetical protein
MSAPPQTSKPVGAAVNLGGTMLEGHEEQTDGDALSTLQAHHETMQDEVAKLAQHCVELSKRVSAMETRFAKLSADLGHDPAPAAPPVAPPASPT